jgi:DNA repair exonuclease SbcCD ATPase subunit
MRARLEAERQISDKLEMMLSQLQQGLGHLQQELDHCKGEYEDSIQQYYKSEQRQMYVSEFEQQKLQLKLAQCERERQSYLHEIKQLRDNVDHMLRERTAAIEERDHLLRQKDSQICDLQRQLREVDSGTQEHSTNTTQMLISLGDGWNVPREEIELFPDREIGRGSIGLVIEGRYQGQQVAVKQIHQNILENSTIVEEFRREIGIMASVKHPNLVRFIAAVFDDAVLDLLETPLLVSELLNTNLRKAYERGHVESQQVRHSVFRDVAYTAYIIFTSTKNPSSIGI